MTWPSTAPDLADFATCQSSGHVPMTDDDGYDGLTDVDGTVTISATVYSFGLSACTRCGLVYWREATVE